MNSNYKSNIRLSTFISLLLLLNGCYLIDGCCLFDFFGGGHSTDDPVSALKTLSPEAKSLIDQAFKPYKERDLTIADHHVHIIGSKNIHDKKCHPDEKTDTYLNCDRFSCLNPFLFMKTQGLMSASKINDRFNTDEQFNTHLLNLAKSFEYKVEFYILALDGYWEKIEKKDGSIKYVLNKEKTDLYISNNYAIHLANSMNKELLKYKSRFKPVISVHPYNPDALKVIKDYRAELNKNYNGSIGYIKWLPNAMNLNPKKNNSGNRGKDNYSEFETFYKAMIDNDMVLMSHTGWEEAINVYNKKHQTYGFPGFIEDALDAGVTVILSHSGGDNKLEYRSQKSHQSFLELVERASRNPRWNLYGDISGLTIPKNIGHFKNIIGNKNLKYKMLYGSDYPLPATYILYPVDDLIKKGYLDKSNKKPLKEIFEYNPLVFDIVVKRMIKHPDTDEKLPYEVFLSFEENYRIEKDISK